MEREMEMKEATTLRFYSPERHVVFIDRRNDDVVVDNGEGHAIPSCQVGRNGKDRTVGEGRNTRHGKKIRQEESTKTQQAYIRSGYGHGNTTGIR